MDADQSVLDQLQAEYKKAVDDWVVAIRTEEALASVDHSVAKLDEWEQAHDREHKQAGQGSRLPEAAVRGCPAPRVLRVLNHCRHCEEPSDEAIHGRRPPYAEWITSLRSQ